MPTLVDQVAQLRREIADVRAAELEAALRTRKRMLEANTEVSAPSAAEVAAEAEVNVSAEVEAEAEPAQTEPIEIEASNGNGSNGNGSNGKEPKNPFPKFEAPSRIPAPHEVDIRWRPLSAEAVHDR